jgi:hypothetical protein
MVFDRLFLWIFSIVCTGGTMLILFRAPTINDPRMPVDQKHQVDNDAAPYLASHVDSSFFGYL